MERKRKKLVVTYDVIIFEDLDSIKNYAGLFVKLREMNTLLNSSKIIKKDKITFIYAVKDDVFPDDKERTKFFEFIIPVIPVINSNNSEDKLLEVINEMPYEENLITVEENEGEIITNVNTANYNQCQVILKENYDGTVDVYISLYQSLIDKIYGKEEFKSFGYFTKSYKNFTAENVDINWNSEDNICKMTLNTSNDVKIANIYYLETREEFDIILNSKETDDVAFDMIKIWTSEER